MGKWLSVSGRTIQATIRATISRAIFLSGGLDDGSNYETGTGTISFPNGKTWGGGQSDQGLYEITFREEFAKMNELTRSITLSSGVRAMGVRQEPGRQPRGDLCMGI